jgi:hypothetical protein
MSSCVREECPQCKAPGVDLELLTTYAGYFVCHGCQYNWREPSDVVKSRLASDRVAPCRSGAAATLPIH